MRILIALVFLAPMTAMMAQVSATILFVWVVDLYWLSYAVFFGAILSLAAISAIGYLRHRGPYVPVVGFLGLIALALFGSRIIFSFYPAASAFLGFIIAEVLFFTAVTGLYGTIETFVTVRERDQWLLRLNTLALCGRIAGGLLGFFNWFGLLVFEATLIVVLLLVVQVGLVLWLSAVRENWLLPLTHKLDPAVNRPLWVRLKLRYPIILLGICASFLVYVVRAQLHILAVSSWGSYFLQGGAGTLIWSVTLLFTVAAITGIVGFFCLRGLMSQCGVSALHYFYPIFLVLPIVYWVLDRESVVPSMLCTIVYLGLLPGIYLFTTRLAALVLPRRFIHDTLFLSNGLFGALGMIAGAGIIILLQPLVSTETQLYVVLAGALLFGLCAFTLASVHRRGWLAQLRGMSWREVEQVPLSAEFMASQDQVIELLRRPDLFSRELGVLLATESTHPEYYLTAMQPVIRTADEPGIRARLHRYLAHFSYETLAELLQAKNAVMRFRTLAAMVVNHIPIPIDMISNLLHDDSNRVRLFACMAAWQYGLGGLADVTWQSLSLATIPEASLAEFMEVLGRTYSKEALIVLKRLAYFPSYDVRVKAMHTLGNIVREAGYTDPEMWSMGLKGMEHDAPEVRSAAVRLLVASKEALAPGKIAFLLGDLDGQVRSAAAEGLADLQHEGIVAAREALHSDQIEVVAGAIEALALAGAAGQVVITDFVEEQCAELNRHNAILARMLAHDQEKGEWAPAVAVLDDAYLRMIRCSGIALATMGYPDAATSLTILAYAKPRWEDSAAADRVRNTCPARFIHPVFRTIFKRKAVPTSTEESTPAEQRELLQELIESGNRWLLSGAVVTWYRKFTTIPDLPDTVDPLVKEVCSQLSHSKQGENLMDRLLFLRQVPFFSGLVLDELLMLDHLMIQENYAAHETIFQEGNLGDRFYLVYQGRVSIRREPDQQVIYELGPGAHLGELSLFEETPRSATAIAETDCVLLTLAKHHYRSLMLERPLILFEVCKELSRRLRETTRRLTQHELGA